MPAEVAVLQPTEIGAAIASHPPLMQEEAREQYLGREIEWLLPFSNGLVEHGQARLTFYLNARAPWMIVGAVSLADYPWLKSLPAKEMLRVRGRIRKIDAMAVYLDIAHLSHEAQTTSTATMRA